MDRERYQQVRRIYLRALELEGPRRMRLLDEECVVDPTLREEVLDYLAHAEDDDAPVRTRSPEEAIAGLDDEAWSGLTEVGAYRLVRMIAAGGMGFVFEGRQLSPERRVAIKLIRPSAFLGGAARRFQLEADLLARVEDPGVARIYEAGVQPTSLGDVPFLAMEYVDGEALADRLARRDPEADGDPRERIDEACRGIARLARSLQVAHDAGVVHRDVKPSNIILRPPGEPVLIDFGIARVTEEPSEITRTGGSPGTPPYMSPEQLHGGDSAADVRVDVWGLGVTLYEWLCGVRPFDGPTDEVTRFEIIGGAAPDPARRNPAVPMDLTVIVQTALERDLSRRYATAAALADDLERFLDHRPIVARRAGVGLRIRRWARRNPAATVAMLLLSALLAVTVAFSVRTSGLVREAQRERRRADEATAESLFVAANRARDAGRWSESLRLLDQAEVQGFSDSLRLALERVIGWNSMQDARRAREALRAIDVEDPSLDPVMRARALLLRGDIGADRSEHPDAGSDDVRAALDTGALPPADAAYARAWLADSFDGSLALLDEALRHDPRHVLALDLSGTLQIFTGRLDDARLTLTRMAVLYPEGTSAAILDMACRTIDGDLDGALASIEEADFGGRDDVTSLLAGAARVVDLAGRMVEATGAGRQRQVVSEALATGFGALLITAEDESVVSELASVVRVTPAMARYVAILRRAIGAEALLTGLRSGGTLLPAIEEVDVLLDINREGVALTMKGMLVERHDPVAAERLFYEASNTPAILPIERVALTKLLACQKSMHEREEDERRKRSLESRMRRAATRLALEHDLTTSEYVYFCTWLNNAALYDVARLMVNRAMDAHPDDVEIQSREAHLEFLTAGYGPAVVMCDQILDLVPGHATATLVRGWAEEKLGFIGEDNQTAVPIERYRLDDG